MAVQCDRCGREFSSVGDLRRHRGDDCQPEHEAADRPSRQDRRDDPWGERAFGERLAQGFSMLWED
jgi:hypothetical protein